MDSHGSFVEEEKPARLATVPDPRWGWGLMSNSVKRENTARGWKFPSFYASFPLLLWDGLTRPVEQKFVTNYPVPLILFDRLYSYPPIEFPDP